LNHQTLDWSTRFKDFWDEQGLLPPYNPLLGNDC